DTKGHKGGWIVIAFGWAMAVYVGVWCVEAYSGAQLNPAMTIGAWVSGKEITFGRVLGFIIAQMLGAMIGSTLVYLLYRDHYVATADPATKLGTFATGPAIRNPVRNLFSEALGTGVLVLAGLLAVEPELSIDGSNAALAGAKMTFGLGTL
ncbi:MIP/aquaporin family protein, partial [Paraburkholderia phenoliruptrix]|uniref:MIP/aquaporin family protein n=1 Tax=Paraburkholderia phenoliruptrix TaxID=252970 RepID=UPI0034CE4863